MKKYFSLPVMCFIVLGCSSQNKTIQTNFFRIYEDNDGINTLGIASDWGYTNGTRLDFYHQENKKVHRFLSGLNLSPGRTSIATSGWGLMQVMITPKKIMPVIPDKNDYPYSGALLISHIIHSANEQKKLNLQTEWIFGVMGSPSFAREIQIFIHHLFGDVHPNGWGYQLPTDLLINYNLTSEKQFNSDKSFGLIGGGQVFMGTLADGLSLYGILRFEKNIHFFSGLAGQYFTQQKKKPGFMLSIKPIAGLSLYNALLDGGFFNKASPVWNKASEYGTKLGRKKITGRLDLMVLFSLRNFSISFTQEMFSPDFKGYNSHCVGNVSVYFGW